MNSEIGNDHFVVYVNKVINEILIASSQDDRNLVFVQISYKCRTYFIVSWHMIKQFENVCINLLCIFNKLYAISSLYTFYNF